MVKFRELIDLDGQKVIHVANGTASDDAVAFGQVPAVTQWTAHGDVLAALAYAHTGVISGCTVAQHSYASTPTAVAGTTTSSGTSTSATCAMTVPATASVGQLGVAAVITYGNKGAMSVVPSGWTLLTTVGTATSAGAAIYVYTKVLVSGDINAVATWTLANSTTTVLGVMEVYVASSAEVSVTTNSGSSSVTSLATASLTTLGANRLLAVIAASAGFASPTVPAISGATARQGTTAGNGGGNFNGGSIVDRSQPVTGASTLDTATIGSAMAMATITLAMAPVAAIANMMVDISAGKSISTNTGTVVAAQPSLVVTTADATNTRYDIVSVSATGTVVVTAGTPAATPAWPTIPTGNAPLALLTVTANKTSILTADITDLRTILASPKIASARAYARIAWR